MEVLIATTLLGTAVALTAAAFSSTGAALSRALQRELATDRAESAYQELSAGRCDPSSGSRRARQYTVSWSRVRAGRRAELRLIVEGTGRFSWADTLNGYVPCAVVP